MSSNDLPLVSIRRQYTIVCRLASMIVGKNTIIVFESRYDRIPPERTLRYTASYLVEAYQFPAGDLAKLQERILILRDRALSLVPEINPQIILDTTRSPLFAESFPFDPYVVKITTAGTDKWEWPVRILGRLMILSRIAVDLRDRRLIIALPERAEPPNISSASMERALSNAETKTPTLDLEEALFSDSGPDDDLVIATGTGLIFAAESIPDPFYVPPYTEIRPKEIPWLI